MQAFLKRKKLESGSSPTTSKEKQTVEPKKENKAPAPWVEKYRPRTVDEVAFQEEVVAVLKKTIQGADLPNLLFYGPPGTGKTSTILAAARELFGDMYKSRILELNASDERGIQVVRDKVKTFAQLTASGTTPDGKPCPPFKIIILDEADSMTHSAQAALRRTMEKESKTTRFCLICNYVSRIIEPITSRCSKFRFKPLIKDILIQRLQEICTKEGVKYEDKALEVILTTSEGDLRKAITTLQSAHRLKGEEGITANDIVEITGIVPDMWVDNILTACKSDSYDKLETVVKDLMAEGYSAYQLLLQIHDRILYDDELSDRKKSLILEKLAVCDHHLLDGADEFLQIMDLCSFIMQQFCHNN